MMKKTAFLALPFAAALALTGCGSMGSPAASQSPTAPATAEAAAPSSTQVAAPAAPTVTVTATPTTEAAAPTTEAAAPTTVAAVEPETDGGQLSASQLGEIMNYVKSSFPSVVAVISDDATVKASLPMVASLAENMDVEPAVCGELASKGIPDDVDSLRMASISWPGNELGSMNTVGISSYPSADAAAAAAKGNQAALSACSNFSMNVAGTKATVTTKKDSSYAGTEGFVSGWVQTTDAAGQKINTATIVSVAGNNVVTTVVIGTDKGDALMTEAGQLKATTLGGIEEIG